MKSVSIIIPVHNQKKLLERCIKSIQEKTHSPHDIIIVDDASNEETASYCRELKEKEMITCCLRNETQRGFSYTCNRGLKALKNDYYCLLNSDTEIGTDNWLRKVVDVGESDPQIAILGVLSNNAAIQSVPNEGDLPKEYTVDSFSALIEKLTEAKNPEVSLINGFCYFIKQNIITENGFLDEKRYPHYGSEDDYTFHATQKGYKSVIIDSVFVYHKSNASYKKTREKIVAVTLPQFLSDWGYDKVKAACKQTNNAILYLKSKVSSYLNANFIIQQPINVKKLQLSVCMIVKNEEDDLRKCLNSIKPIASEIIIIDTGSIDDTVIIAQEFGAKIFHYEWNDDFAAARNFSLSKATQPYVFILDADESISSKDLWKFEQLLDTNAYSFMTRNYVNDEKIEGIVIDKNYEEGENYLGWCKSTKVRLFSNNKDIKFIGKVHELVEDSLIQNKIPILNCDIQIHHYGFNKNTENKKKYYLELGVKKLDDSIKSILELASQHLSLNNYDAALILFRKALIKEPTNHNILAQIGTSYNLLEDYIQAEKFFLKSLEITTENEYAYKHLAICYAKQNKYEKAYECFRNFIYFCNDLKSFGDFANCCLRLNKYDETIEILEKALILDSNIVKSWGMLEYAYNQKGIELIKANKIAKAKILFNAALKINPSYMAAKTNFDKVNNLKVIKKPAFRTIYTDKKRSY